MGHFTKLKSKAGEYKSNNHTHQEYIAIGSKESKMNKKLGNYVLWISSRRKDRVKKISPQSWKSQRDWQNGKQ